MSTLTPGVEGAVDQIRRAFPDNTVQVLGDGAGGAYILVEDLPIGAGFDPARSWVAFLIPYMYPAGDIYPHWVRPDLAFADGRPLAPPLNPGQQVPLFDRPAVMISRRSNRWNPAQDTALLKLLRVLKFLDDHSPAQQEAA
jgi:hypothetical protein